MKAPRTIRGALRQAAFAAAVLAAMPAAASLEAGEPVPAIVGKPLRAGAPPVALAELRGRVVYVDFWASWCVPCRQSMPVLDGLANRFGPRGLTVVGVNKDATAAEAERFLRRVPVGFPLVADADDAIAKAFGVKAMPSGYLVDRAGVVRRIHRGFTAETAAALEREIEGLLGP